MSAWRERALCKAGCGKHVKRHRHQYCCPACVPRTARALGGTNARLAYLYRKRAIYFRDVLARLTQDRHRLTAEDLLVAFAEIYRRGFSAGWHRGSWPYRGKVRREEKRAARESDGGGMRFPKPVSSAEDKRERSKNKLKAWLKLRAQVKARDKGTCRACGTKEGVDVHHVRFRSVGGPDSSANLCLLCRVDHAEVHAYCLIIEGDANGVLKITRTAK